MKKITSLLVLAGLSSASAMTLAQTTVTLYGIVDTSVRYVTSDNAAGQHNLRMDNGAISNSRFGFKGNENLGGGLNAIFKLEGGFNGDTGGMSSPGTIFNRQSYVGLSGGFGQVTLGRQDTPMFDLLGDHFDPLTVGNYDTNSWLPVAGSLVRTSNMIRYTGTFGPVEGSVSYAAGEQAGSARRGSQTGASLRYTAGPLELGGAAQQTVSAVNSDWKDTAWTLDAAYSLGAAKLFAGYIHIKDSTGTTAAYIAGNNAPAAAGGIVGVARTDKGWFLGSTYQATPQWALTIAGYYDRSNNDTVVGLGNLGDGTRYAINTVAEYALSKRTQVYGTYDYNHAKDAATAELVGKSTIHSFGVGIRHIF